MIPYNICKLQDRAPLFAFCTGFISIKKAPVGAIICFALRAFYKSSKCQGPIIIYYIYLGLSKVMLWVNECVRACVCLYMYVYLLVLLFNIHFHKYIYNIWVLYVCLVVHLSVHQGMDGFKLFIIVQICCS